MTWRLCYIFNIPYIIRHSHTHTLASVYLHSHTHTHTLTQTNVEVWEHNFVLKSATLTDVIRFNAECFIAFEI